MVLIHNNSTCFVDGWQVVTCFALPSRISSMIACVTQLRIRLSLPRVLDGPESLLLLACFPLWRRLIREPDEFKMETLNGRSLSSPWGPAKNNSNNKNWSSLGNETGRMETDIKQAYLVGGFKYFLSLSLPFGNDPIWLIKGAETTN